MSQLWRTTDGRTDGGTESEDRAILKQNSQYCCSQSKIKSGRLTQWVNQSVSDKVTYWAVRWQLKNELEILLNFKKIFILLCLKAVGQTIPSFGLACFSIKTLRHELKYILLYVFQFMTYTDTDSCLTSIVWLRLAWGLISSSWSSSSPLRASFVVVMKRGTRGI